MSAIDRWVFKDGEPKDVLHYDLACEGCIGLVAAHGRQLAELALLREVEKAARKYLYRPGGHIWTDCPGCGQTQSHLLNATIAKLDAHRKGTSK